METARIALALVANLLVGYAVLRAIGAGPRTDRIAFWGLAWLCGSLVTALLSLGWLALHEPIDGRALAPLALAAGVAAAWAMRKRPTAPDPFAPGDRGVVLWITVGLLILVTVDAGTHRMLEPILIGDEANIFAAKAKAMWVADGLGQPFTLEATFYPVEHADYPLLVPLLYVWTYAAAGGIDHVAPRLQFLPVHVAFVLILASSLRRVAPTWLAALLLVATVGHGIAMRLVGGARADMAVVCGLLLAFESYRRWHAEREHAQATLCAIALAWTAWAKNEGLMLALVFVAAIGVAALVARPRRGVVAPPSRGYFVALIPLVLVAGQLALGAWWGFAGDLTATSGQDGSTFGERLARAPSRVVEVGTFFVENVLFRVARSDDMQLVPMRLLLPMVPIAWCLAPRRGLRPTVLIPVLVTFGGLTAYFLVFLITPHDLDWHLRTAAQRISFHVTPLAACALGALLAPGALDDTGEPRR